MTIRLLQSAALCSLLAVPFAGFAQSQTSANEDERLEALIRESEMVYVPKNSVTIGFRVLNAGPKTTFGNLGSVPFTGTVAPASEGRVSRSYHNGAVGADGLRPAETVTDSNPAVQIPLDANGRYQTYSTATETVPSVLTGDFLGYQTGLSRNWAYTTDEQTTLRPGYVGFSNYSAATTGGGAYKEQGLTAGVELQFERMFTKPSRRFQFGFVAGASLSGINNKTSGSVLALLSRDTDFYSLNGRPVPVRDETTGTYDSTTDGETITREDGTSYYVEATTPINQTPDETLSVEDEALGTTNVDGNWQVKGNYFLLRLGPLVRAQLTNRIGLSASAGAAGAYIGTKFTAIESFKIPGTESVVPVEDSSQISKFMNGYYADFNIEFSANERTGFFGGVTAQQFGDYDQTVGGRTAKIDLGNSVGLRGGVSIKF